MTLTERQKTIGDHWKSGKKNKRPHHLIELRRFINQTICGTPLDGYPMDAMMNWHATRAPGRVYDHGISVGCGNAGNETWLLEQGLVRRFTCYELSEQRAAFARELAQKRGVADRFEIHCRDAFNDPVFEQYDFVNWTASLHHMFDVRAALWWTRCILKPGGTAFIYEFAGPNKMQLPQEALDIASGIRRSLPGYVTDGLETEVRNIPLDWFDKNDPSECVDSAEIMPSIRRVFPGTEIRSAGGLVWGAALDQLYGRILADPNRATYLSGLLEQEDKLRHQYPLNIAAICHKP